MSTKSSLFCSGEEGNHKLQIHVYHEGHEEDINSVTVELSCSTCYCNYTFLMNKHLGEQFAELLKKTEEGESRSE